MREEKSWPTSSTSSRHTNLAGGTGGTLEFWRSFEKYRKSYTHVYT
jgi:hypothetical protein